MLQPLFLTYDSASSTPRGERSKVEFTVIQSVEGVSVSTGGLTVSETGLSVGEEATLLIVTFTDPDDIMRIGSLTSLTPPSDMTELNS